MHYFSIHNTQGEHLGFLVMQAEQEPSHVTPSEGQFALKLQSEQAPKDQAAAAIVAHYEHQELPLTWSVQKDYIELRCGVEIIGNIRRECLVLNGQNLFLTDLTGVI